MRNFFLILCFALLGASTSFGQLQFGAGASLNLGGSGAFGVQGKALYPINENINASGTFTYYFEDFTFFAIDADAHYELLKLGDEEDITLSPFAGLNITNISVLGIGVTDININLGAHFRKVISGFNAYAEPKIVVGGGGSGLVISAGVLF